MRRIFFILLAIYLVFLGGSTYYTLVFPIRVFHHALVTLLLLLWLASRLRRRQGLPQTPLNPPLYAAVLVWVFTALTSIDPRSAFENLWFQSTHVLFFFALVELFRRGYQRLVLETQFLLAALVVFLSGVELASWYFGLGFIPGTQTGWIDVIGPGVWLPLELPRLSLAMNISTLLAGYVAPLVILSAAWALTARRQYRAALWGLAGAVLVVLLLTLSRGGLLSLAVAAGTLAVIRLSQTPAITRRLSPRLLLGAAGGFGAAAILLFLIISLRSETGREWGDAGRLDMWRSAVEITRDYPLTGVGPGLFGRAFRSYRSPALVQDKLASAHNAYLNTAAETGLPGIVVSLWLGAAFLRAWLANWRRSDSVGRKIRLEAALAGLVGLGVHSLVDVFTITPIVLLCLLLAAYAITPLPESKVLKEPPRYTHPALAAAALVIIVLYGVWFVPLDRAQSLYQDSLAGGASALENVQAAIELDPALKLYPLHRDYLTGDQAAYLHALALEPTWDTGWLNLAALRLRVGDNSGALEALDRARQISQRNPAVLHWATLAETRSAAPPQAIIEAYTIALKWQGSLPLSEFWWETALRREAVEQFLAGARLDWQYRVLAAHDPARAQTLVSTGPQTAAEWWIAGQDALANRDDAPAAAAAFSRAIELARTEGDYYASRARATLKSDPQATRRDLDIAALLGTYAEYPNAIRAELAASPEEAHRLRANALPPRLVGQEFAAVLYGRPAVFDLLPEVRFIGPGRAAMSPWYTIASGYLEAGEPEKATNVYRAILDYAPDEREARSQLEQLSR
ncbi:MAG: hypothetical protein DWB42_08635 [Chloroflexi bacterium]|nr:hypothetical protein [Chloroflexota bacterium]